MRDRASNFWHMSENEGLRRLMFGLWGRLRLGYNESRL